ncbi:hypothetical protein FH972_022602 [Carpinus fangiana]|uniref:Uncharacterized protein n=1 Tax=Carpinus fangiana TaxID=176857 RepID=A0A5N6KSQ0_9ROSI|nr:hypothetical protein FH972_022602 [Carpinus fangiana]
MPSACRTQPVGVLNSQLRMSSGRLKCGTSTVHWRAGNKERQADSMTKMPRGSFQPVSGTSYCDLCSGRGYSYASSCSQAAWAWSTASLSWWSDHYTVTPSLLPPPSVTSIVHFPPLPPRRVMGLACASVSPYILVSNAVNVTAVRPQFAASASALEAANLGPLDYPVPSPTCHINRVDCLSLWDEHDARPTAQPVPTCSDLAVVGVCNPAYILPAFKSLDIPTYSWNVPITTGAAPLDSSTATTHHTQYNQPYLEISATSLQIPTALNPGPGYPDPSPQPPASQIITSPLDAPPPYPTGPLTKTTLLNGVPFTATMYPSSIQGSATFPPSIVISSITLVPSSTPAIIGGATLSAAPPNGALVSVSSSSIAAFPLPAAGVTTRRPVVPAGAAPAPETPTTTTITIADRTYTATSSSSAIILAPGLTATEGGPVLTLPPLTPGITQTPSSPTNGHPADQTTSAVQTSDQEIVVSAAPDGGIVIVGQSTIVAMPMQTGSVSQGTSQQSGASDTSGQDPNSLVVASSGNGGTTLPPPRDQTTDSPGSTTTDTAGPKLSTTDSIHGVTQSTPENAANNLALSRSWALLFSISALVTTTILA